MPCPSPAARVPAARRIVLALLFLGALHAAPARAQPGAPSEAPSETTETRPNIVWLSAEDLSPRLGAYGDPLARTPNLDRLAATGMRFERCHVQPLCTPTRVQLMTGMYNVRNYTQFGAIDRNVTTFAHLLKEAGYATAIAGKWQLGRGKNLPRRLGFDESCLWQHTRRPPRYANPGLEYDGEERDFKGVVDLVTLKAYTFAGDGSGKMSESAVPADMSDAVLARMRRS